MYIKGMEVTNMKADNDPDGLDIEAEQLVIHPTFNWRNGRLTIEARAIGSVKWRGRLYEFNRVVKFRAQRTVE